MTPEELEALADADAFLEADNHAVIAAVAKCQKVTRDLEAAPNLVRGARTEGLGRGAGGEPAAR